MRNRAVTLGIFWLGIQAVWSAVLGIVLQERATAIGGAAGIGLYAALAAGGAMLAAAVQVAAGFASDRQRRRSGSRVAYYAGGALIAATTLVVLTSAGTTGTLIIAFLVLQIGMNVAIGPFQAIVADYLPQGVVGAASSWMSVYQFSGSVLGLLAATLLHGATLGIVLALVLLSTCAVSSIAAARSTPEVTISAPLRLNSAARTVIASRSLINVGFYTLFGFLFFFVRESLGVTNPRTTTGILFLAFTIAGIAGAAIAGRPADRLDKRIVVTIACAAIAVAVSAFALAPTVAVALACAIGAGAAWGAFFTADWAIAYAVLPTSALAAAMGVWNLAAALPQVLAPLLTVRIVDAVNARHFGAGPRVALALVVVEFMLGTAWLWRLRSNALTPTARVK